ncbi:MFS transporter [Pararobbsia alpina]|uniref:Inner membrane transport protein RhmT n=1 Tax=Pararobbsia alpina TaxID=621374 RepID=A0A6S7BI04_9BURK|nr:MFS transporter [Pararobbsia alpina]CAB3791822.1 Inner membrane transport protein RhmT [Pararobbsia alpina]
MSGTLPLPSPALGLAVRKARWRLLPFLLLMYLLAFLDRANVGFAKNVLQADVGIGDVAFAFGAGVFFVGYAIFEIPSNLIMYRLGARIWMSRIMITWGIIAAGTALVHDSTSFYVLRFVLGIAEAGFFPGIILFLSNWFPVNARAQSIGVFYTGFPLAFLVGSPLSGMLLDATAPLGLHSWQWLFIVEGLAASVIGIVAYFYLTDRPALAHWLEPAQREALVKTLKDEDEHKRTHGPASVWAALHDRRVLYLTLIYFVVQIAVYGVVFYLPTRIAALMGGHVGTLVGFVTAIPWLVAIVGTLIVTRLADRIGHHRLWCAGMLLVAALGIAISAMCSTPVPGVIAFCFATVGFVSVQPLFWALPTAYLGGAAAAGGIALINSIGNLGGFFAPNVKTYAEHAAGTSSAGMYALAASGMIGVILLLALGQARSAARPAPNRAVPSARS